MSVVGVLQRCTTGDTVYHGWTVVGLVGRWSFWSISPSNPGLMWPTTDLVSGKSASGHSLTNSLGWLPACGHPGVHDWRYFPLNILVHPMCHTVRQPQSRSGMWESAGHGGSVNLGTLVAAPRSATSVGYGGEGCTWVMCSCRRVAEGYWTPPPTSCTPSYTVHPPTVIASPAIYHPGYLEL